MELNIRVKITMSLASHIIKLYSRLKLIMIHNVCILMKSRNTFQEHIWLLHLNNYS